MLVGFRRLLFLEVRAWTRQGRLERRTAIVGADANGSSLINALARQPDSDLRIIGIFDDRSEERAPAAVPGYQKLGTIDDLVQVVNMVFSSMNSMGVDTLSHRL